MNARAPNTPAISRGTWSLEKTQQELALAKRLGDFGIHVGDTTPDIRRDRFRHAIARIGETAIVGRGRDGKPVTFAQAFQLIYGEAYLAPDHHDNGEGV